MKKLDLKFSGAHRIFFITQAFDSHGHGAQHDSQLLFIKRLVTWSSEKNLKVFIKKHPRDLTDYKEVLGDGAVEVIQSSAEVFY